VQLLASLTGERAIYLTLALDRSWTEMIRSAQQIPSGGEAQDSQAVIRGHRCPSDRKQINYAGRSSYDGIPSILNISADCEPSARCPVDLMPLPSRSTSADLPVVLDTTLLLCSFLLPATKETRSNGENRGASGTPRYDQDRGRNHLSLGDMVRPQILTESSIVTLQSPSRS
jgi:hypothetical protein